MFLPQLAGSGNAHPSASLALAPGPLAAYGCTEMQTPSLYPGSWLLPSTEDPFLAKSPGFQLDKTKLLSMNDIQGPKCQQAHALIHGVLSVPHYPTLLRLGPGLLGGSFPSPIPPTPWLVQA